MFFPKIFSFTILVATAAADLHKSCVCFNGNTYEKDYTISACTAYNAAGYKWGSTLMDSNTGRCTATYDGKIGGNEWESACQTVGKQNGINSGIKGSC